MAAGDTLFQRLRVCTVPELDALAGILDVARSEDREFDVFALSKALRSAAGDSFANIFRRDHDLEYREILVGVARTYATIMEWSPVITENTREEWLEDYIGIAAALADHPMRSSLSKDVLVAAAERADAALRGAPPEGAAPLLWAVAAGVGAGAVAVAGAPVVLAAAALATILSRVSGPATRKTLPSVLVLVHARRRIQFETALRDAKEKKA